MEKDEIDQYQRHFCLDGFGQENQLKLNNSSVLVIGAGGLGCPVLQYLAAAGVGRIGIVDHDNIHITNLHRQVLFSHDDIGKNKAQIAAEKLSRLNPFILLETHPVELTNLNCDSLFKSYDVIIDGTDNFSSRYLINDACVLFKKPLVHGSIHRFEGMVSVFNFNDGPTFRCLFPDQPDPESIPTCAEAGVLGVLPGIIGSMQGLETIKIITGIGTPLSGEVLLYDALNQSMQKVKLSPDPANKNIKVLPDTTRSCSSLPSNAQKPGRIQEISEEELQDMMLRFKDLQILDVREHWERELMSIQPSIHLPLGEISSTGNGLSQLEVNPKKKLVIYCKAGVRSRVACQSLQEFGFLKLYNLSNGIDGWALRFPDQTTQAD